MIRDLGPGGLATLSGLGPFATLWTRLGHHFHDPRLRQLFGRYATYCGASPWLAPATLMLIAHVEQSGVWSVRGGMHALPRALAQLAARARRGAALRPGACERILVRDGRACGVRLADGRETRRRCGGLQRRRRRAGRRACWAPMRARAARAVPAARRSLSALTWAMHARSSGFALARHNVFFDDDYRSRVRRRLPPPPPAAARHGLCLRAGPRRRRAARRRPRAAAVPGQRPAPTATADPLTPSETEPCLQRSLELLQHCGLQLEHARRNAG